GDVRLVHRGGCAVGLDQCDLAVPVVVQVDGALSACELVDGRLYLGCRQPAGCVAVCDCLGVGVDLFQQAVAVGEGVDPSGIGYGQGVGDDDGIARVLHAFPARRASDLGDVRLVHRGG